MNMLSDRESDALERSRRLIWAISRWNNEGGAGDGGRVPPASAALLADALPPTSVELVRFPDDPSSGPDASLVDRSGDLRHLHSAAGSVGDPPRPGQAFDIGSSN